MSLIIDCHGHYTTAPKALDDWRNQQIAAQVLDTWKSPMWCAMKEARGENKVMSLPRSFISLS